MHQHQLWRNKYKGRLKKTEEFPPVKTHQALLAIQFRGKGKNDIGSTKNWLV